MVICRNCLIPMVETMSFQPRETKHIKVMNSELTFGECISKEIQKAGRRG